MDLLNIAKGGDLARVRELDINLADENGKTALHYAAELGNTPIVQSLLYYGAEANATDRHGFVYLNNHIEQNKEFFFDIF